MSEQPGTEELEVTGREKLLAVLLAIFIAIGAFWVYFEIDDLGVRDQSPTGGYVSGPDRHEVRSTLSPEDRRCAAAVSGWEGGNWCRRPYFRHQQLSQLGWRSITATTFLTIATSGPVSSPWLASR